jgi:ATP-grasp domain-containing protein
MNASGSSAPTVLLTDTNRYPSPARMAIGLSKAGCRIAALCPTRGHPLLYTHAVGQKFPYSALTPLDSIEAAINGANPDLIIPCDDRGVRHLHELHARAVAQGEQGRKIAALLQGSLGAPASYPIVASRYELLRIAAEEGLRVPQTKSIKTAADLDSLAEFPWVLKADGTYGGLGVRMARDSRQAREIFAEMDRPHRARRVFKRLIINRDPFWLRPWWNRLKPSVIAQSYIQGHPANCAAFAWQGKLLACTGVEVVSSEGLTGPAGVVRVIDNSAMVIAAERIAARLNLSGVFGLDFMIEQGTGETYLIEMNPRSTPLCHFQLGGRRDLVSAIWSQISGQPFRESPPVTESKLITYFPQLGNSNRDYLKTSYYDVPVGEPDLVRELLNPWPDRSFLYKLVNVLTSFSARTVAEEAPASTLAAANLSEAQPAAEEVHGKR